MLTAFVDYRVRRNFNLSFDLYAASNYTYPFYTSEGSRTYVFPGPVKGDVVAAYTLPLAEGHEVRFYTRIENVFNQRYYEDGFRTPGAWAVGGVKFVF